MVSQLCEVPEVEVKVKLERPVNPLTTPIRDNKLRPPTLMVSTSTAIIPISLSSSHSLASPNTPPSLPSRLPPLAIRRGKKQLTPLNIAKAVDPAPATEDTYPGIPTAFLGSPSPTAYAHSPGAQFFAPTLRTIDMQLDEMLADLRARAAALPPGRHTGSAVTDKSVESPPSSGSSGSSTDGWATVDGLLETYHRQSVTSPTGSETSPESSAVWSLMLASPTDSESSTPASEDDSMLSKDKASVPAQAATPTPAGSRLSATAGPRPSRFSDPPKRGILKTTKVVRFTEPPEERVKLASQGTDKAPSPPLGLQAPTAKAAIKKPSPLRQSTPVTPAANRDSESSWSSEAGSPPPPVKARPTTPVRRSLGSNRPARPLTPVLMNRRHTVSPQLVKPQQRYATMPHSRASNRPSMHAALRSTGTAKQGDENAARRADGSIAKGPVQGERKGGKFKSLLGKLKG
ncbi:hypothetical protein OE88DRAFT_1658440 [Heliocybe sulcata]|uniref:Uncharacterized protein n=1 Tax=Heliocybe sulcata TaxID=5364 RepID=A0A5C3N6V4_9AGAM|nr:hypothetical protein OE88DRAFT_1658440 [Heliocybe sulcata]